MNLTTFNGLFREYRIAIQEVQRGPRGIAAKVDAAAKVQAAELAVLRAASELAEGQLSAKLQDLETTILGVREEAHALYAELSELNGQYHDEYREDAFRINQGDLLAALKDMLLHYAPGADDSAARNGEDNLHSAVRKARLAIREFEAAPQVTMDDVLAAVDAEKELPGDMPEDLWRNIRMMDKAQMTEFLRQGVRDVKEGIRERIRSVLTNERTEETKPTDCGEEAP